jgi:hypothetical protein
VGQGDESGVIGMYLGASGIHTVEYPRNKPVYNIWQLTHFKFMYFFVISVTKGMVHFFSGRTEPLRSINASNRSSTIRMILLFNRLSFFIIFMIAKVPIGIIKIRIMTIKGKPTRIADAKKSFIFCSPLNFDKICGCEFMACLRYLI